MSQKKAEMFCHKPLHDRNTFADAKVDKINYKRLCRDLRCRKHSLTWSALLWLLTFGDQSALSVSPLKHVPVPEAPDQHKTTPRTCLHQWRHKRRVGWHWEVANQECPSTCGFGQRLALVNFVQSLLWLKILASGQTMPNWAQKWELKLAPLFTSLQGLPGPNIHQLIPRQGGMLTGGGVFPLTIRTLCLQSSFLAYSRCVLRCTFPLQKAKYSPHMQNICSPLWATRYALVVWKKTSPKQLEAKTVSCKDASTCKRKSYIQ